MNNKLIYVFMLLTEFMVFNSIASCMDAASDIPSCVFIKLDSSVEEEEALGVVQKYSEICFGELDMSWCRNLTIDGLLRVVMCCVRINRLSLCGTLASARLVADIIQQYPDLSELDVSNCNGVSEFVDFLPGDFVCHLTKLRLYGSNAMPEQIENIRSTFPGIEICDDDVEDDLEVELGLYGFM